MTSTALVIGLMFQFLLISHISSILVNFSISKQKFQEELRMVNDYMRSKAHPLDLRDRVRDFYGLRYRGQMFDERQILSKLSTPLRNEILHYNSRELYPLVPLLRNTPEACARARCAANPRALAAAVSASVSDPAELIVT